MTPPAPSPIALALGRVPSGLFIVTARTGGAPLGFVGSLVQQVGFEPPTVCVAFGKERSLLGEFEESGHFGLSILDEASRGLMRAFLKRPPAVQSPFDGLRVGVARSGTPVLLDALAWVDCRISGRHDTADHTVVFGEVVEGALLRSGDPHVHLRKSGLGY